MQRIANPYVENKVGAEVRILYSPFASKPVDNPTGRRMPEQLFGCNSRILCGGELKYKPGSKVACGLHCVGEVGCRERL